MDADHSSIADAKKSRPVRLFFYRLDCDADISLAEAEGCLSADERLRAEDFVCTRSRHRYVRGRGYLRRILARQLHLAPESLRLLTHGNGRPYLAGSTLSFNVSHSGDLAICALSQSLSVAVDLELHQQGLWPDFNSREQPAFDGDALLRMVFSKAERQLLLAASDRERRRLFFEFWTAKEALMKLTGRGLSLAPDSIELFCSGSRPRGFSRPQIQDLRLHKIDCGPLIGPAASCHLVTLPARMAGSAQTSLDIAEKLG
ncbi:4'-phosphopantetheinyl transferase family protein [Microbulbifer aestuariivivens]|uniref:4'-phosphopantetheinyl transferase family protein n=1 Tax=Microbulbifer aestuariivivens TaxID=1908308 RepID=UPI0031EB5C8F